MSLAELPAAQMGPEGNNDVLPSGSQDTGQILSALQQAYQGGDVLALLQAIRLVKTEAIPLPSWAIDPYQVMLIDVLTKHRLGTRGKGNLPFGALKKALARTVRASAYHYVRAWQRNPHRYTAMPRASIKFWYDNVDLWNTFRSYSDAARLAEIGLRDTPFHVKADTVRRAAIGMPHPVAWGRQEVEGALGLRSPEGVFGLPPDKPPHHVQKLLSTHPALD